MFNKIFLVNQYVTEEKFYFVPSTCRSVKLPILVFRHVFFNNFITIRDITCIRVAKVVHLTQNNHIVKTSCQEEQPF